jgi:hypothetical protein
MSSGKVEDGPVQANVGALHRHLMQPMTLGTRARRGFLIGFGVAILWSTWATVGRVSMGSAGYASANGPWLHAVLTYLAVLPLVGAVVGLLSRFYRYAWGAAFLGFLAVFSVVVAFGLSVPIGNMSRVTLLLAQALVSAVIGGGVGLQRWSVRRKTGQTD